MAEQGKKVLIADDEADMRAFVQAALEDDGYTILEASDGEAALEVVRAEKPDLVILDVQMPKKNGFEVFDDLRRDEATKGIPIVMLTGVRQKTGIGFNAKEMGDYYESEPEAYVEKPVDPDALRDAVAKLLGQ
ncbi:MAG TPA: response regulator [Planctomycetota bacterium]|nr:response regulator [Planctomycetota bacterium]